MKKKAGIGSNCDVFNAKAQSGQTASAVRLGRFLSFSANRDVVERKKKAETSATANDLPLLS